MSTSNGATNEGVTGNGKKPGGCTGKGFKPGQSGNPNGSSKRQRAQVAFGDYLRDWMEKNITIKDENGKKRKLTRKQDVLERLMTQKPDVLLHYCFGKPAEMIELSGAEGGPVEFTIKVNGKEMP